MIFNFSAKPARFEIFSCFLIRKDFTQNQIILDHNVLFLANSYSLTEEKIKCQRLFTIG